MGRVCFVQNSAFFSFGFHNLKMSNQFNLLLNFNDLWYKVNVHLVDLLVRNEF